MKRVLITGANSFVGTNVEQWLQKWPEEYQVKTVDTMNYAWMRVDISKFDVVFHVAGIAHVNPKPSMASQYYKVNRDLTLEIARWAKDGGVKQFIYMSSKIVYHTSKNLKGDVVTLETKPNPNDFYGDSKLQAEKGLHELECDTFNVAIMRPPMIYGPGNKGNLPRLAWLATKVPIFPAWHNKRSMLHVFNLAEFIHQIIDREMSGIFYPQNTDLADTVEIVRTVAKENGHKVWISRIFNPIVWLGAFFFPQIPKMFSDSFYDPQMSKYDFDYQVISFKDSLKELELHDDMRW